MSSAWKALGQVPSLRGQAAQAGFRALHTRRP